MADLECSLTFSTSQARKAFSGGPEARSLVLALLAGIPPRPDWEGCLVFVAARSAAEVQVGCRGPGAEAVHNRLGASLQRVGIEVLRTELGVDLDVDSKIARVIGGAWC